MLPKHVCYHYTTPCKNGASRFRSELFCSSGRRFHQISLDSVWKSWYFLSLYTFSTNPAKKRIPARTIMSAWLLFFAFTHKKMRRIWLLTITHNQGTRNRTLVPWSQTTCVTTILRPVFAEVQAFVRDIILASTSPNHNYRTRLARWFKY